MTSIDARLRKLEEAVEDAETELIILYGDEPAPEGLTKRTVVLRFDEEDRGL